MKLSKEKSNVLTALTHEGNIRHPERVAFHTQGADGQWHPVKWNEFHANTLAAARALSDMGVNVADNIVIFSPNRGEWLTTDFAAYQLRAVPVAIYSTSSASQVKYILNDTRARIAFAGGERQLKILQEVKDECPALETIISYDPAEGHICWKELIERGANASEATCQRVDASAESASPEDIATLIYTSGTTGEPKGAILPHSCFNATLPFHRDRLTSLSEDDSSVAFLPLSHIFEKGFTYVCLFLGIPVWVNSDPHVIEKTLREVKPTCMCAVPRFWEKVYTAIQEKIAGMGFLQRAIVGRALKVGRKRNNHYVRLGLKVPRLLEARYRFYDKRVFSLLRKAIGFERPNIFPTAGAPLDPSLVDFFHACGLNIMIGYGLSETTATVTCFPYVGWEAGSVGTPLTDQIKVKISDVDNEILISGPTVMRGYYNKPEATAEAFTEDGWLRTGDAGRFDEKGALVLTERIKDLFKTSNGKYIAPQMLESRLGTDKYIEQVAIIGDQRKYVTAIIIPAFEALKEYAQKKKIQYRSLEDLVKNADIRKLIEERIATLQQGLSGFEQVKKFTLLPKAFTMESGELTNTLKIRRPVIADRYRREIDAMYV